MRNPQPPFIHKLLAIFLMAVLFFVQGVKVLHRHDHASLQQYADTGQSTDAGERIHGAHGCPICDYHLAKDAELPQGIAPLQVLSCQYITYPFRPSVSYPGMSYVHTSRGPPACFAS